MYISATSKKIGIEQIHKTLHAKNCLSKKPLADPSGTRGYLFIFLNNHFSVVKYTNKVKPVFNFFKFILRFYK